MPALRMFAVRLAWVVSLSAWGSISAVRAQPGQEQVTLPRPPHHEEPPSSPAEGLPALGHTHCDDGTAAGFPCDDIDLLSFVPLADLGAASGHANDVWGWTDPGSGREFVLLGVSGATLFVEITNPTSPRHLGRLATHTIPSAWRDVKVYQHYAFVVSEAFGHGMQVFDLSVLLDHEGPPATFDSVAHYDGQGLGSAHNIAINEDTGFAYIVGSNTCSGGLHIVDVRASREPAFAGCFSQDGYTHDVQCVLYEGPDGAFREREICYAANEDTLTIVDVTDKRAPRLVSRTSYPGVGYTHQVWTTEDQHFLLLNDELDEVTFGHPTRTRIWDITDLERPVVIGSVDADRPSIDHNLYVHRGLVFQANYRSGLLVYDLADVADGRLRRVGVFDVYRADDAAEFNGAWSVYPFFPSGTVAVSGIEQGLFLLDVAFEGHSH